MQTDVRIERDSLGEVEVPTTALYGAQTQRAVNNFPVSGHRLPRPFLHALALIKGACATANREMDQLDPPLAEAIEAAAAEVARGFYYEHFPVDVFQTGSGTSTNMNANEVIATLASQQLGAAVHPNDHVNRSQSSNDVIPTALHLSAYRELAEGILPTLDQLRGALGKKAEETRWVVKTGRTHLMDAMPIRMSQEIGAWEHQVTAAANAIRSSLDGLSPLAIGGTAVGTGVNAPAGFGPRVAELLAARTGHPFTAAANPFAALSGQEAAVQASGALKTLAVALTKIANDLRWMNSGPNAGLGEISLPALQPGSSIMPGKINPVIPEAAAMACARVIGNDVTITIAGQSGSFQLNGMLPLIAHTLHESIQLLSNSARLLSTKVIPGFEIHSRRLAEQAARNPILVTALAPSIGYDRAAEIAQTAARDHLSIRDAARMLTDIPEAELDRLLDPASLTGPASD